MDENNGTQNGWQPASSEPVQSNQYQSQQTQPAQQAQPAHATQGGQAAYNATYGAKPAQGAQPASHSVPNAHVQPGTTAQHNQYAAASSPVQPVGSAASASAKKGSGGKTFLIAFAGALVACVLALGVATATNMFGMRSSVSLGSAPAADVEAADVESTLAEAVANKCLPSVGAITVYTDQTASSSVYDYLFGYGYGSTNNGGNGSDDLVQSGMGSGVVLSDDGYMITNNHVVDGGVKFEVSIEGETYEADLVGQDSSSDVAVLKIKNADELTPIQLGDSDDLTIGEWVMSIGSPFGLEQSVATGIVSATSRSQIMDSSTTTGNSGDVTFYPNMIQTDAAINPGNSGGALVDANGQLIGINTLITSYSGNYSGVGFAIPVNYAVNIAQDIIEGREPTHAQLGVSLTTVTPQIAQRYGFSASEGAYISAVVPNSGAANAGLEVGDVIVEFDGEDVDSASDLTLDVRTKAPGDTVKLKVNRDGEEKEFDVTLGSSQNSKSSSSSSNSNSNSNGQQNGNGNGGNGFFGQPRSNGGNNSL